jgi:multiple sugar transport system substrate-binding protein
MKKKVLATLLVGAMAASLLAGCGTTVETTGSSDTTTAPEKTQTTETAEAGEAGGSDVSADITLWTYPIGEWGNAETVDSLILSCSVFHFDIYFYIVNINVFL